MPAFYRQGMASISMIFLNNVAAPFGDSALAAMTIVTRTMQFLGSALIGFGQGFQPVAGFSWGANRLDRLKESFKFSVVRAALWASRISGKRNTCGVWTVTIPVLSTWPTIVPSLSILFIASCKGRI